MKEKKTDLITAIAFCGFLGAMALGFLLLPKQDFSPNEKRYLEKPPVFSWEGLSSGEWGEAVESYLADHMPGRNFFVGLNAYYDLLSGRQAAGNVRVWQDRLLEAPAEVSEAGIQKNLDAMEKFSQTLGVRMDLMLVPSAGWAAGLPEYRDGEILEALYRRSDAFARQVELGQVFGGKPEYYYKTDHHWNSAGAYAACKTYMDFLGRDYPGAEEFTVETFPGFQGSTYSRSALWLTPGEPIQLWNGAEDLTVVNGEDPRPHDGVFYRERLEEPDMYTVFLDGNHSLVRITNPRGTGKLLVIRDSYANCLGCFLAQSFREVVLVDLRYYKNPVSQLAQEGFDNILMCYSIGNFLTDTNIMWLR